MKIHLYAAIFFLVLIMGCDAPTNDLTKKAVSEAELKRDTFLVRLEMTNVSILFTCQRATILI